MDHSRVAERIARGELTPEEGAAHPDAHKLSQALGVAPALAPSVFDPPMQLATGDVVLLCSDGLYDMVDETEMCALIEGRGYAEAVPALIEEANRRGGHDNIGVAIVVAGERRIKQSNGGAR